MRKASDEITEARVKSEVLEARMMLKAASIALDKMENEGERTFGIQCYLRDEMRLHHHLRTMAIRIASMRREGGKMPWRLKAYLDHMAASVTPSGVPLVTDGGEFAFNIERTSIVWKELCNDDSTKIYADNNIVEVNFQNDESRDFALVDVYQLRYEFAEKVDRVYSAGAEAKRVVKAIKAARRRLERGGYGLSDEETETLRPMRTALIEAETTATELAKYPILAQEVKDLEKLLLEKQKELLDFQNLNLRGRKPRRKAVRDG
jgi:hypothetical protein